jgi:hypothetical protein
MRNREGEGEGGEEIELYPSAEKEWSTKNNNEAEDESSTISSAEVKNMALWWPTQDTNLEQK